MMRAMSQPVLRTMLAVVVLAPFAVAACNLVKKDEADAGAVATATASAPATTAAPTATPAATDTSTAAPTVAPLGSTPAAPATPGKPGTPVKPGDGGAAPATDGGKPSPGTAPTPTLTIPTAIPGFDAGGFKPPPGFPSSLPTFPPPPATK
jgi:hypothetical protein